MEKKIMGMGLTFDDVLLVPQKSTVLPASVDTTTRLTKNIMLNIPIISAAMDTVSEYQMGIAMAREGGIAVIHKNMTPEEQAVEVDKVKRSESGMITDPVTIGPDANLRDVFKLMEKFAISGIPVVEDKRLVGIITNRDIRFEYKEDIKVRDIMTKCPLVTAKEGTSLEEAKFILQKNKIEKLPIVDADYNLKGMITFKDIKKKESFPNACKDGAGRLRVAAAISPNGDDKRIKLLVNSKVDIIVLDSAHGHHEAIAKEIKRIKSKYHGIEIIAGNIATTDGAEALIKAGADAVKVGIGPGSICTTRVVAGVGVPQITAIQNAAIACKKYGIPLIADGGIKYSGDIAKAIGMGADCVMLGSMLAGTDEAPGEMILFEGRQFKSYRGMGSLAAMKKGSADRYFQVAAEKFVPEGIEGRIPYKGRVGNTIYQMVGGLRQAMGYCGVKDITEMKERTKFIQMTHAGLIESHPHDVQITREAPNYEIRH
jgi:IMP dehydrogenase